MIQYCNAMFSICSTPELCKAYESRSELLGMLQKVQIGQEEVVPEDGEYTVSQESL
jgi:hypothetical protein